MFQNRLNTASTPAVEKALSGRLGARARGRLEMAAREAVGATRHLLNSLI
jgi:hypothetical protein